MCLWSFCFVRINSGLFFIILNLFILGEFMNILVLWKFWVVLFLKELRMMFCLWYILLLGKVIWFWLFLSSLLVSIKELVRIFIWCLVKNLVIMNVDVFLLIIMDLLFWYNCVVVLVIMCLVLVLCLWFIRNVFFDSFMLDMVWVLIICVLLWIFLILLVLVNFIRFWWIVVLDEFNCLYNFFILVKDDLFRIFNINCCCCFFSIFGFVVFM